MWKSPNGTIRNILGGVVFREPIVIKNPCPDSCPAGQIPSSSVATRSATSISATDFKRPRPRQVDHALVFEGDDGSTVIDEEVFRVPILGRRHGHVQPGRFSIRRFRPRQHELWRSDRGWPLYLSTKNTILKAYDGRFKDIFQDVFDQ